jgi:hypothetical protein
MLAPLRLYEWPAWPELVADIAGIRTLEVENVVATLRWASLSKRSSSILLQSSGNISIFTELVYSSLYDDYRHFHRE